MGAANKAGWLTAVALAATVGFSAATAFGQTDAPNPSDNTLVLDDRPQSFADLAERLLPAVVNISTTQTVSGTGPDIPRFPPGSPFEDFFDDFMDRRDVPERRATSLGSGFIIDSSGYIVTNNHVIADADEITVILQDDSRLVAELIGTDDRTDLAVLRVEPEAALPAVPWGDSEHMRVGDWVVAIGNPFGLGGSVTAGIISARARDINAGPYDDFIQTDASINRGNSGGPMFNLDGEVIGINTAIYSPTGGSVGVGFAIPSALTQNVVAQIIEYGRTRRGWLGVRIQSVTDEIAESLGMEQPRGALVSTLTPGGPADGSGIEPGDIIVEFNGEAVPEMRRLPRIVAETPVGEDVSVVVWRGGELLTYSVTLGELEAAEDSGLLTSTPDAPFQPDDGKDDDASDQILGFTLSALDDQARRRFGLSSDAGGVLIIEVMPGSDAEFKGLRPGDLIVEVSQESVTSPADVRALVDEARQAGRQSVLLLVDTAGDLRFVAVNIDG